MSPNGMPVTAGGLLRAAGGCASIAGLLFIVVQLNHPPMDVATVTTSNWAIRSTAKALMAALALVGITGMYLSQVGKAGVLGLVGYVLFATGYLLLLPATSRLAITSLSRALLNR